MVKVLEPNHNQWTFEDNFQKVWDQAISDVAHALGYEDAWEYNGCCYETPREVRKRIRAL